ncbi:tRNA (N6-threonylcarbamoyladenosine(37)-N6)-methyltransferase TrmO [Chitinimonas lacunae]|uniref:tRNA (N6-threonylcarbamoyladenosine(37)-N6)-methyltransferase TrmO n=1 Tax=Chitinimonas lacunae TaxID=1963018 RepID=A0ABV8MVT2_9NEIS
MNQWTLQAVAQVESCFKEKFAIPRQPGLTPSAEAVVRLLPPFDHPDTVRGLEAFSHLWLVFVFHGTADQGWRPTVRPPKLGGNARTGVFASRSTFRPNPVGLSVVKLLGIDTDHGVSLRVGGADLLDGTPVLDIKPYLAYADAVVGANSGYADTGADPLPVAFTLEADAMLQELAPSHPHLRELIREVLAQDPRPGYADDPARDYGMRLYDLNIRWRCDQRGAVVHEINYA